MRNSISIYAWLVTWIKINIYLDYCLSNQKKKIYEIWIENTSMILWVKAAVYRALCLIWPAMCGGSVCVYLCLKDIYGYALVFEQIFIFSQFWRLHVWNPGTGRVDSFWRFWGESVPCTPPSFCCLPAILGIPRFVDASFQSAFIFAWCSLLYLLVSTFLFL